MAEPESIKLRSLKGDSDGDPDAAQDVSAENTGFGRFIAKGLSSAAGAMATLGAGLYGRDVEPGKTASGGKKGVVKTEPHPQCRGHVQESASTLDKALKTVDELNRRKSSLTIKISRMDKDIKAKRQEIIELQTQLAVPQEQQVVLLKAELDHKDTLIAEKQARIERLLEGTTDSSVMLARSLGETEAKLASKDKELQLEQVRVRASKTCHAETRKELDMYKEKCSQLTSNLEEKGAEPYVDVESIVVPNATVVDSETQTDNASVVHEGKEVHVGLCKDEITSHDPSESFTVIDEVDFSDKSFQIEKLKTQLSEKERHLSNMAHQLNEAQAKVLGLEQVKDHSKVQSRQMLSTRQELEATKMSHDDLVQFIGSLEYQIEEAETHSRKLELDLRSHKEDYKVLNEAFITTKQGYELKLESQNLEMKKLKQERNELENQLEIARTEAQLYEEDFKNERKDRENAHHLKEEMRLACDEKKNAFERDRKAYEETIVRLTQRLEEVANEKDYLQQKTRAKRSQQDGQKYKEVVELEKQLFESQQRASAAEEDVLAKTAQVKQYKKKDDQREQMVAELTKDKEELTKEMGNVRKELEKTKQEYGKMFEEQKLLHDKAMEQVRSELEKAKRSIDHLSKTKKLSKSDVHAELVRVQEEKVTLLEDYKKLDEQLHKVQGQFAHLMKTHRDLKQQRAAEHAQTPGAPKSTPSLGTKQSSSPLDSTQVGADTTSSGNTNTPTGVTHSRQLPTLPGAQQQLHGESSTPDTPSAASEPLPGQMKHQTQTGELQQFDTYSDTPRPRILPPESPTRGYPSMPDRFANNPNAVESDSGLNRQALHVRNPLQGSSSPKIRTGPLPSLQHLKNEPHVHSAPNSSIFPVSQEAAGNTGSELVLGENSNPHQRPQTLHPNSNQPHYGYQQEPYRNSSGFDDQTQTGRGGNHPMQGHDYNYQQDQRLMPQRHSGNWDQQASPHISPGQWPDQQQQYRPGYQQQPPQGMNPHQPGHEHFVPAEYHHQQSPNDQCEYGQAGGGPQQQYWSDERYRQQPHQYNQGQLQNQRPSSDYPKADDVMYSQVPADHDAYSESNLSRDPPDPHAHNPDSRYGVDLQSPHSEDPQEKPKPKPRQLNAGHKPEELPSPPDPPSPENPNATRLLVEQNALHDNIGKDISEAAAEVTEVTQNEKEREGAPLDPNLVCPMCMKQYRIGEIQLFRAHVNKCDGTKH